jgi:choline dehydrogenase-like flavoprotein
MSGNYSSASGLFEHPLNEYKGIVSGAAILDFVPSDPKRGFYGGGRMTARGQEEPIQYGLQGPHDAPSWGLGYKRALREQANRKMVISSFLTQLPLESNRVDLDPDVKDAWGLAAMRLTSTSHPEDFKCMEFFRQKSIEILQAAGATTVWAEPVSDARGGAHSRGTCRSGRSIPPCARCTEFIYRGWQQPGHRWPQSPDDDDPGTRVPRGGSSGQGSQERKGLNYLMADFPAP